MPRQERTKSGMGIYHVMLRMKNDGTFGAIDDLTITYSGNRLLKVTDDAEALNYNGALDFYDGSDEDCEYEYDTNGGLTQDKNKGVTSITYDYGHNTYQVRIIMPSVRGHIINDYNSDGRKLSSRHSIFTPTGHGGYNRKTIADLYIDGLMLRNDTALLWKFSGGYVELNANGTPTCWNYYIADHLGSTRMVVDSNNSIKETINYYPFGSEMKMEDPALLTGGTSHPYRFTGKELDRLNSLNMYDFGARWYDVAGVPMWTSVDPLAEKYYNISPYAYCNNNPVNAIDPEGKDIYMLFYTTGNPQGDEMFKAAAETRKYDIEHSKGFNSENDIVLLNSIEDISDLNKFVNNIVDTYSSNFGKTIEFGIWSHSGIDGPIGSISTSSYALEGTQMSMEGWSNIHFNWADNASATFYGCRGGISENGNTSFTTKVSGLNNFKDVYVYGQTAYSYPSQYTNVRRISLDMMRNNYSYPIYMVGGIKGNGAKSLLFGLRAYPMRISRNGFGIVGNIKMKKIISIFSLTAIFIISTIIILGWDYNNSNYYNQFGWKSCGGATIKNDVIYFNSSFSSLTTRWLKIYDNTELAGYILFCYDGYLWIYSCREKDRSHKGFGKYKAVVYAKGLKKNMDKHSPDSLKRKE